MKDPAITRLIAFLSIFIVLALWEWLAPRRKLRVPKYIRWIWNLGMHAVNMVCISLLILLNISLLFNLASSMKVNDFGLLWQIPLPIWANIVISLILFDFIIYVQHVLFHQTPLFWRLHKVHHTDLDLDITSALRFHPLEIILSLGIKMVFIVLLGPHPLAILIFEIVLNGMAMFNHGNIFIFPKLDKILRRVVVTPDMHRTHHSVYKEETDSNYGFNLSCWDRLFHTYRENPKIKTTLMCLGLENFHSFRRLTLYHLLIMPFIPEKTRDKD